MRILKFSRYIATIKSDVLEEKKKIQPKYEFYDCDVSYPKRVLVNFPAILIFFFFFFNDFTPGNSSQNRHKHNNMFSKKKKKILWLLQEL